MSREIRAASKLPRGLYDGLVTEALAELLDSLGGVGEPEFMDLRNADAADRIAFHVAKVIENALDSLPDEDRAAAGVRLARYLIDEIAGKTNALSLVTERPTDSLQMLRAIRSHLPDGSFEHIESPLIPLLDTALLTNAPGEPRVGRQIQAEIASSDRIDVIMAFIRRTGIAPLRDELKRHVDAGRNLRVLTTTYTGSTEAEALDLLRSLGAQVRISYDTSGTRLHAKAWLFHRESGFSLHTWALQT